MGRIVNCHGAVQLSRDIVEPQTEEQREGEAAHWVGQQMLLSRRDNSYGSYRINLDDYLNVAAPNGVIITEEMFDAALTYYNTVMKVAGHGLIQQLHIEEPVAIQTIHPECWGTPDSWLYDAAARTLHLWDFKYGHASVSAVDNYQLISYDVGILDTISNGNALHADLGVTCINNVVQPRCYDGQGPVRSWSVSSSDLRSYVNIMKDACERADKPGAMVHAGAHCIGCPARSVCPAILTATSMVIDYVTSPVPVNPTNEALAFELMLIEKAEKLLKYRRDAVEQETLKRIHSGQTIPGYYMEQGYTNNKWMVDDQTVIATGKLLGVDFSKPGVLTPAQAKKELERRHMLSEAIDSLLGREPTAMKLARESTTRARQIFSRNKI